MFKKSANLRPNILVTGIAVTVAILALGIYALSARTQFHERVRIEHPKIPNPASLSSKRAESIYRTIRKQLRTNYLQAGDPIAEAYQTWQRFNRHPYRSPNHGERFVNHYGNAKAADYMNFEKMSPLPEGAIIIKDSFTATRNGDLKSGPLFMMEKMPAGFRSLAGVWRFMMLRGDGVMIGMTDGLGDDKVRFCAECHVKAGPEHDFLYFMPQDARIIR